MILRTFAKRGLAAMVSSKFAASGMYAGSQHGVARPTGVLREALLQEGVKHHQVLHVSLQRGGRASSCLTHATPNNLNQPTNPNQPNSFTTLSWCPSIRTIKMHLYAIQHVRLDLRAGLQHKRVDHLAS
jgi:hypothetical protein